MIISASRRTDIPAFYGKWFCNRLEQGYVLVRNPMNRMQVSRVELSPEQVDCIVFWTKNPEQFLPMLPRLDAMGYRYCFLYTLTPYGPDIEPAVPARDAAVATFLRLSEQLGPERVIWRYDPVIISSSYATADHVRHFAALASELTGATTRCIISFVRFYRKCFSALKSVGAREPETAEMLRLLGEFKAVAQHRQLTLSGCCLPETVSSALPSRRGCIDRILVEELTGQRWGEGKDVNQRPDCRCMPSIDIGQYDSCPHLCRYCYANNSPAAVRKNYAGHDADSPLIYGSLQGDETITLRTAAGRRPQQLKLF